MERNRIALIVVVLATIGSLSALDLFLARTEDQETRAEAQRDFRNGVRLLAANQPDEAADQIRKAYSLDRSNQAYALQLIQALMASGKLDEAQTMLTEILQAAPNNGEANLLQARLMARDEKRAEAVAYYHRAIYGIWNEDPATRRVQVRLELADYLAAGGSDKDLLAELLPLESDAHDLPTRKQVARLYLVANSPARAAAAYRALIRDDPKDRSDYAGLGQAELVLGDYHAAQVAFQNAGAEDRAKFAADIASLDPTLRRLSAADKFARSQRVLQMARDTLAKCQPGGDDLLKAADEMLAKKIRTPTNELAEERLGLAEQIWDQRLSKCGPSSSSDEEALRLVMSKLSGR
jgi:predicted Zn-dependent protease